MQDILQTFWQSQFDRYSQHFNFFLTKPINLIVATKSVDFVIAFRDLQFLVDESEYLKRYYTRPEIQPRLEKLTEFYECNIPNPTSNLMPTDCYFILQKRQRKLIKMMIKKEKENEVQSSDLHILQKTLIEVLYDVDAPLGSESEDDSEVERKSFQSSTHDVFEKYSDDSETYRNILDYESMKLSPLILNFRTYEKNAIKIEQPIEQEPPQPKREARSNSKSKSMKKETEKRVKVSTVGQGLQGKATFMEYYYSVSPKRPNLMNKLYKK